MFEEDLENISVEEQKEFIDCMEELFEAVALGNGDYTFDCNGDICICD